MVVSASAARAQVVGQYNIPAAPASAAFVAPSAVVSGLTFSTLVRGSGLSAAGAAGTFTSFGFDFNTADADAAKAAGDYLEFTVTPDAGTAVSLDSLTYTDAVTTPGPANIVVQSSADGFLSSLAAYSPGTSATERVIALGSGFSSITSALTFRIIGFNANNPNSGSSYALQTKPLVVNGAAAPGSGLNASAVAEAPEPGSLPLAALGAVALLGMVRMRRRAIV